MPARRTPLVTGRPAISTPRQGDENAIARSVDNTRERIEAIEAEVLMLGKFLDANTAVQDLLAVKTQLARLAQTVNLLVAQVGGLGTFDEVSFSLSTEAKMRHIARAAARDLEPPNSANAILMASMFSRR